jgi:hypothetical protein
MIPLGQIDVMLLPDAAIATRTNVKTIIQDAGSCRLVGFLNSFQSLTTSEQDHMLEVFGIEPMVVPGHGMAELAVDVVTLGGRGGPRIPTGADVLDVKRRGIWHHPIRTRRIVRLARALQGERATLAQAYPLVSDALQSECPPSVLILVESVEHALALGQRLGGWPILCNPDTHVGGMSAAEYQRLDEQAPNQGPAGMIATLAVTAMLAMSDYDVVIRADGGSGALDINLDYFLEAPPKVRQRRLLLIDFADHHHPVLRRWSRRRQQSYDERGWCRAGETAVDCAARHFVRTRARTTPGGAR